MGAKYKGRGGDNVAMAGADGKRRRDEGDDHGGETKKTRTITTKRERRSCYLPEGISREVLLRLPVKSLLRFRSINRSLWRLISTERFAADHLKIFRGDEDFLLSNRWWCTAHLSCQSVNLQVLDPLYPKGKYRRVIVGCCDGLVCLICSLGNTCVVVLWNPTIRRMVRIPTSLRCLCPTRSSCRFGFGSVNNEYKLVAIPRRCRRGTLLKINVFCFKTLNWDTVTYSWTDTQHHTGLSKFAWVIHEQRSVFVNGACHWLAEVKGAARFVLSFDLSRRSFGKIVVPSYLGPLGSNNPSYTVKIFVYDGCLSLIATMTKRKNLFAVWTMEQYGVSDFWTRKIESENLRGLGIRISLKGGEDVSFWNNGKVVVCHHRITNKHRSLKVIPGVQILCRLHAYKESIVLLNRDMQSNEVRRISNQVG